MTNTNTAAARTALAALEAAERIIIDTPRARLVSENRD